MENIIEINHLSKYFGNLKAVDDISFCVKKGELFGFLGVNGAGKSTTINMLCTLIKATNGSIRICNETMGKNDVEIRKHIGVVFQDNTLDGRLTIRQNLITRGYLYHSSKETVMNNLNYVCEALEIGDLLNRQFKDLSGGQKRRCEIARALMNKPEILFLDEPTTGLDPQTRKMLWNCLETLRKEEKMTIFLTTHYMEEAAKAHYIGIIDAGKLVAYEAPQVLKEMYAHDRIKVVPKDKEKMFEFLKNNGTSFKEKSNHISITLENTLEAIPLINGLKDIISSFEVIQGTMDDVFLNITGKSLEGGETV
ncbi:MAG: ATP-binding cassette domain-containing protein [Lachnotalea sp.]